MLYLPGHLPSATGFWPRLREVLLSLVGLGGALHVRGDEYADLLHATLLIFGVLAVVSW